MDGFNADDFNHFSHYDDQGQNYPWAFGSTDPTFLSDDPTTIHLNSNTYQDIASNVSGNPYNASLDYLPAQGLYSNGALDSFDHSTGMDQFLIL
jgi:hypothetical protein